MQNFIILSTWLTSRPFITFTQNKNANLYVNTTFDDLRLLTYSYDQSHNSKGQLFINNQFLCICRNIPVEDSYSCNSLLDIFSTQRPLTYNVILYLPCVIQDITNRKIYIISDSAPIYPIFYEFRYNFLDDRVDIIVTDDILNAINYDFYNLTPVDPGVKLTIDYSGLTIFEALSWQNFDINDRESLNHFNGGMFHSIKMYTSYLQALLPYVFSNKSVGIVMELDPTEVYSVLFLCAAEKLGISITIIDSNILMLSNSEENELRLWLSSMKLDTADDNMREIWESSLVYIASRQYTLCKHISDYKTHYFDNQLVGNITLLSPYHLGLISRISPIETSFLNHFCNSFGVKVEYPFAAPDIQTKHWIDFPPLNFQKNVLEFLADRHLCPKPSSTNRKRHTNQHPANTTSTKSTCAANDSKQTFDRGASLTRLWRSANKISSQYNEVVVLLVTSGYADLFTNFLCFAADVHAPRSPLPFLVITPSQAVVDLAVSAGLEAFPLTSTSSTALADTVTFGTLSYQELLFLRSELVLDLLLLGFTAVVADIDTVWLKDPLLTVRNTAQNHDIVVTEDRGEICGGFIYLNYTYNSYLFWTELVTHHRNIIDFGKSNDGKLEDFFMSEQKALTKMLLAKDQNAYQGPLKWSILSTVDFPSGFEYFNQQSYLYDTFLTSPSVVHNNYIIGKDLKKSRFLKYGYWRVPQPFHFSRPHIEGNDSDPNNNNNINNNNNTLPLSSDSQRQVNQFYEGQCSSDSLTIWKLVFPSVWREASLPTLSLSYPIHDSHQGEERYLTVQIHWEGDAVTKPSDSNASQSGQLYYDAANPYSYFPFDRLVVLQLNVPPRHSFVAISVVVPELQIALAADVLVNGSSLAIDFNGDYETIRRAHIRVAAIRRHTTIVELRKNKHNKDEVEYELGLIDNVTDASSTVEGDGSSSINYLSDNNINNYHDKLAITQILNNRSQLADPTVSYTIRVLAYSRPDSLLRLLASLESAEYDNNTLPLIIIIDAPRAAESERVVQEVVRVAESFHWSHGEKSVITRPHNAGLRQQWFDAWDPPNESEAAFVFEDDVEVSPLYFLWASAAVDKYYRDSSITSSLRYSQLSLHRALLYAVRREIAYQQEKDEQQRQQQPSKPTDSNIPPDNTTSNVASPLSLFLREVAGYPLLYGICLQRQHLDPTHYPKEFRVRNGNRPYLYSLVGSWGPLMFPLVWQAFREWWVFKSHLTDRDSHLPYVPFTPNLITNSWYRRNPEGIWTPWQIRFAYETGSKCLYANFPSNFSLVVNHREKGENYEEKLSVDAVAINRQHLLIDRGAGSTGRRLEDQLMYLPSMVELVRWQIDFNSRRVGVDQINREEQERDESVGIAVDESRGWAADMVDNTSGHSALASVVPSSEIWSMAAAYLEDHFPPRSSLLHAGISPLLPLLLPSFSNHSIYEESLGDSEASCSRLRESLHSVTALSSRYRLRSLAIHCLDNFKVDDNDDDSTTIDSVTIAILTMPRPVDAFHPQANVFKHVSYLFLVVESSCIGAPHILSFEKTLFSSSSFSSKFILAEKYCKEGELDSGFLLFRRIEESSNINWLSKSIALEKRLVDSFVHTIIVGR